MAEMKNVDFGKHLGYQTDRAILTATGSEIERRDGYWRVSTPDNRRYYWGNFLLMDQAPQSVSDFTRWLDLFQSEFGEIQRSPTLPLAG